jgi:hypothetical protein
MCVLVQLRPDGRLTLPWRGDHSQNQSTCQSGARTIGQQYVRAATPRWYTLADVLAGIVRDGVVPDIAQALEFVPSVEHVATRPLTVFGQVIDPARDVVWTRFIDLRRAVKKASEEAKAAGRLDEAEQLHGQQHALKEIALAGSYGILEELNEKVYEGQALSIDVYALGHTRRLGNVVEEPGPYFAGAIGTLIPAGARLLLALAEQLLRDRGVSYAFMDTDSVTPIRPAGMTRQDFESEVQAVVDRFVPLNPFAEGGSLLGYEDQNEAIEPENPNAVTKELTPLSCIAISAKRYVEFNVQVDADGTKWPLLRKFTSHGLGAWGRRDQDAYALPDHVPPPHTFREQKDPAGTTRLDAHGTLVRIPDATPLGGPLWVYTLYWEFVFTLLNERYPYGDPLYRDEAGVPWYFPRHDPWLDQPAFYQFSVDTWADYERMRHIPGLRPGGFITVYPRPTDRAGKRGGMDGVTRVILGPTRLSVDDQADVTALVELLDDDPDSRETTARETLLAPTSEALYSPYVTSAAEAGRVLDGGEIRRIADDTVVPPDTTLKTMYDVVLHYFHHREEKAANPDGVGELARRHIEDMGDDVIGKESNTLAEAAAQDTDEVVGGVEQLGGRGYGPADTSTRRTSRRRAPHNRRRTCSSLFDEALPDLLAASCLARKTVERALYTDQAVLPETLAALEQGMHLLSPTHPQTMVGWRDTLTPEKLAAVLGCTVREARDFLRGQRSWTADQQACLIAALHPGCTTSTHVQ